MSRDEQLEGSAGDLLTDWVSTMLTGESRPALEAADPRWPALTDLLLVHRLAYWMTRSDAPAIESAPASTVRALRSFRDLTTRMNGANLVSMRRVTPEFAKAGIPVVVFKGPVLQRRIYGELFLRPSSDIDLLVSPIDFARAALLLENLGYRLAPECRSLWWRLFLGERHFLPPNPGEATIDLHLRLQQPGAPQPAASENFLRDRWDIEIAGQSYPTLSPAHDVLLCAISFVKALHHREPSLRYLVDLRVLENREPTVLKAADDEARRQRLRHTLALARRAAAVLLGPSSAIRPASPHPLPEVDDPTLRAMVLRPAAPDTLWPKRRRLLASLCDLPGDFFPAWLFMMSGEAARRVFQRAR